jgi:hypothetical protein
LQQCVGSATAAQALIAIIVSGTGSLSAAPARASVTDAVYEDAKSVIGDLLTAEVAHSVIPAMACRAGRELRSSQPGAKDTAEDYHVILDEQCETEDKACLERQKAGKPTKERYRLLTLDHYPRTLQRAYARQFGTMRAAVIEESSDLAALLLYRGLQAQTEHNVDRQVLKFVGIQELGLFKDLNRYRVVNAHRDARRPGDYDYRSLTPANQTVCEAKVRKMLSDGLLSRGVSLLDRECGPPALQNEGTGGTSAPPDRRELQARRMHCELARSLRAGLEGKHSVAEEHLIRATALAVTEVMVGSVGDLVGKQEQISEWVTLGLRRMISDPSFTFEEVIDLIERKLAPRSSPGKLVRNDGAQNAFYENPTAESAKAPEDSTGQPTERIFNGLVVATIAKSVDRISTQWQIAAAGESERKLDLALFVDMLTAKSGALNSLCADHQKMNVAKDLNPGASEDASRVMAASGPGEATKLGSVGIGGACAAVTAVSDRLANGRLLWPIIRTAARGDFREVAHMAVLTVFRGYEASGCADPGEVELLEAFGSESQDTRDCHADLYRRFAESVVVYVIDTAESGAPSEATRVAFRKATTEVIQEIGKGGGIDRSAVKNFFMPGLSLRASWNAGYVHKTGSSLRYIPSVSWLTFRGRLAYAEQYYAALHLSFIDPLAIVSELAVRDMSGAVFVNSARLVRNIVTPRFDVVFGIPALSRHLVVGAGASWRLAVPLATGNSHMEGDTLVKQYSYEYFWSRDRFRHEGWRFVEFGFLLKYIM